MTTVTAGKSAKKKDGGTTATGTYNIVYCSIFVVLCWAPFVYYHTIQHDNNIVSILHATVTLFNAINSLICIWEIALYKYANYISTTYNQHLKPKYGQKLPSGFVLLDKSDSLLDAFSLQHWSNIWSTYSLLDPSYADSTSFGFWIDVGNGHFFLLPSLLLSFCITVDEIWLSNITSQYLSPRNVGLFGIICNYVMMHGTFLYFASYIYNKRYVGCTVSSILVVIIANSLWIIFPIITMYTCYYAIHTNTWNTIFY